MKKVIVFKVFTALLLIPVIACAAGAARTKAEAAEKGKSFISDGFVYEITDTEKQLVTVVGTEDDKLPGGKADIVIPALVTCKDKEYSVRRIGEAAFAYCDLTKVTVSEGIEEIGDSAFAGCAKLVKAELPSSLNSVGNAVFSYCAALEDISVDSENKSFVFSKGMLYSADGKNLYWVSGKAGSSLKVPAGTVKIMPYAFEGNKKVKKVVMQEGLTTIGKGAFFDCSSLTKAQIPSSVSKIDGNPFMYCSSLTKIKVSSKNSSYSSTKAGLLLNAKKTSLISASAAKGELVIPSKVKKIGTGAAAGNTRITSVVFDAKLENIASYAFADCNELAKVTFANRKAKLETDGQIFKNTRFFMEVSIPYSEKAGSSGSIEEMVRNNSGKGVIITSR